jgi:HPt (histidine-containing phosphotransfer) domain-containing protein
MDDYLSKPLTIAQLRGLIKNWLGGAAAGNGSRQSSGSGQDLGVPVFDFDAAATTVGGNLKLLAQVCKIFDDSWQERQAELKLAVEAGDPAGIRKAAHKVKGSAAILSAGVVADVAGELERRGAEAELDGVEGLVERLESAVEEFQRAVSETSGELSHL